MREISLETPLYDILGARTPFLKRFEKIGIKTARDLLWRFPSRYEDFSKLSSIADLTPGELATIQATVEDIKLRRTRRGLTITEAILADATDTIRATWFNQSYISQTLHAGRTANFAGKVSLSEERELYLNNPTYEIVRSDAKAIHTGRLVPVYPETKGLTSRGIRFALRGVMKRHPALAEWIPHDILSRYNFPDLQTALRNIHFPDNIEDALVAQKRFRFENLFLLQLVNLQQKLKLSEEQAPAISIDIERIKNILATLPFSLTPSQKKSLWEIVQDLARPKPMNRLLQGDVGSGKTIVAAIAAIMAAEHGFQSVFMAPTEILARQHFDTFRGLSQTLHGTTQASANKEYLTTGLITSSNATVTYVDGVSGTLKKAEFWKKSANGEIAVLFGTHALIQKSARFKNLGLVIVDEQHRFGVKQRQALLIRTRTDFTPTDTDYPHHISESHRLMHENITCQIRVAAFAVKKELGLGHKETIYQKALEKEFKKRGLAYEKEKVIDIKYDQEKIGVYRPDFIVDRKIIVELKALPSVGKFEKAQILHYLKATDHHLALLINFGKNDVTIERIIHGYENNNKESGPLESVLSPRKSVSMPHFLSMSATPIPRTLMITVFGNLDLSLITELPAGRKPIITKIVTPIERQTTYEFIRGEIKKGRQAFVICPLITQTDTDKTDMAEKSQRLSASSQYKSVSALELASVEEEYEKLSKKIFPELELAMLHGKMKPKEKESIMSSFAKATEDKRIDMLIATSIIEVGVDVPNASIMIIEGADRFGLAQLYQFRGRIGRGEHQSYCFLMTETKGEKAKARLRAILTAKNGFELAEEDLKLRGPGEFFGEVQSGFSDATLEALRDPELVKTGREAAVLTLRNDPPLARAPALKARLSAFEKNLHRE